MSGIGLTFVRKLADMFRKTLPEKYSVPEFRSFVAEGVKNSKSNESSKFYREFVYSQTYNIERNDF